MKPKTKPAQIQERGSDDDHPYGSLGGSAGGGRAGGMGPGQAMDTSIKNAKALNRLVPKKRRAATDAGKLRNPLGATAKSIGKEAMLAGGKDEEGHEEDKHGGPLAHTDDPNDPNHANQPVALMKQDPIASLSNMAAMNFDKESPAATDIRVAELAMYQKVGFDTIMPGDMDRLVKNLEQLSRSRCGGESIDVTTSGTIACNVADGGMQAKLAEEIGRRAKQKDFHPRPLPTLAPQEAEEKDDAAKKAASGGSAKSTATKTAADIKKDEKRAPHLAGQKHGELAVHVPGGGKLGFVNQSDLHKMKDGDKPGPDEMVVMRQGEKYIIAKSAFTPQKRRVANEVGLSPEKAAARQAAADAKGETDTKKTDAKKTDAKKDAKPVDTTPQGVPDRRPGNDTSKTTNAGGGGGSATPSKDGSAPLGKVAKPVAPDEETLAAIDAEEWDKNSTAAYDKLVAETALFVKEGIDSLRPAQLARAELVTQYLQDAYCGGSGLSIDGGGALSCTSDSGNLLNSIREALKKINTREAVVREAIGVALEKLQSADGSRAQALEEVVRQLVAVQVEFRSAP